MRLSKIDAQGKALVYFTDKLMFPDGFLALVNSFTNETRMLEFKANNPDRFDAEEEEPEEKSRFQQKEEAEGSVNVNGTKQEDEVDSGERLLRTSKV